MAVSLLDLTVAQAQSRYSIVPPGLQGGGVLERKQDPPQAHEKQR